MSRSHRKIYYHLKELGLKHKEENNQILKEVGIFSVEEFVEKPSADRRRIITLLYDLGYTDTANYLKTL